MDRVCIDVYRNQSLLVYTQCLNTNENSQTFIFSNGGGQSFNKTWTEYLKGFEIGDWHWWLGLENILAFNRMGHRKIVFMIIIQNINFNWEFGYENFTVSDADKGYVFELILR